MTFSHGNVPYLPSPFDIMKLLVRSGRDLYEFIMFSSIFVGLAAIGMVYTSCFIQKLPVYYGVTAIMFLTAYSVYNLNRKTDEDEDSVNHQGRYAFTKRNEGSLFISAVLAYCLALAIAAFYGLNAFLIALIPLVSGILYSLKWAPPRSRYRRLKDIPVVKNFVVAFAWSSMLSLLPDSLTGTAPDERTFMALFMFFSYAFIASTIPDIRDKLGDARAGVKTLPVIFGERRTTRFLMGFNLVSCLVLILISLRTLPFTVTGVIAATMVYNHLCLSLLGNSSWKKYVYDLLADGQYIFFAAVLFTIPMMHLWRFP
jgi:4-hydroxybenzoate polyprenyltransferase